MATPSWEDESIGTDVAAAGRLVSDRITRDVGRAVDLEEALEASRYASHPYSSPPKEWPPFIEVVDTRNLPAGLIDRYNSAGGEGTALCGLFPEIRRAWASVDNSLFLWRFDKWDGQCPEYSCEEQAICAVGLVKAKPGIFVEAIQYLLMLATPIELILVGVCCSTSGDGTDPYAEITLQCLPEYTVSLDGVTMTCITCTDEGRIFLAGRDSHIYEVQYSTGSGWQKRCRKICHTSGLGSFASRWLLPNVLNFGLVDPVVAMVVDNERHILYARTQESKIQVFDLGINGDGPVKRIAEEKNLVDKRDISYGSSQPSASRTNGRTSKPSIVSFAPLSSLESKWLHLVAVLSDGRRMYLSTSSAAGGGGSLRGLPALSTAKQRPCLLKVVAVRPSPSVGVGSGLSLGAISVSGRPHAEDLVLKLDMSYYSSGIFVLSDSSPSGMSCLLVVNRDPCSQSSGSNAAGAAPRNVRALRETVSSLPVEGRMLAIADLLPPPITSATVYLLYAESCGIRTVGEPFNRACAHLWALGDLATQHILPRRKIVIFSTMGIMEVVFNRPVDILRRLLESNTPRSLLEDFFNRFGAGEAAAMCLLLAAKLMSTDDVPVSNIVSEKAMEAFEDSRLVGVPQVDGSGALSNTVTTPVVGFNMGQVVQEAEPVFSGAHEGLCLCTSRLLVPVWEFPVAVAKNDGSFEDLDKAIIASRLSAESLIVLETKIRLLEQLLRSRRNQKRGLYGCISGLGDITGSILYGASRVFQESSESNPFGGYVRNMEGGSNKRPRLPFSPAELAAMEVRAMECIRRLLRRSAEALFLLRILVQHHIARLIQTLDVRFRQKLVHLTFQQLVCSDEGEELATRLIAALMEYYIGPEGRGTVDDISGKLREGCPSYYRDSDYKFFQAVECIERAAAARTMEERESLAKEAFDLLLKIPESADLQTVCKRFEELRFYEAVVRLPLQKAQALDPAGNAFNSELDASSREQALSVRHQCYEIITDALHSLKSESGKVGTRFGSSSPSSSFHLLDQASRDKYIRQIVQLGVQYPDKAFHEYLYAKMIEFGLENELLEFGGQDLVPFLQNAGRGTAYKSETIPVPALTPSPVSQDKSPLTSQQLKYLELLARYYILKKQHMLAAFVLLRLAERHNFDREESLTLEQRYQFLTTALLQAKSSSSGSNSSLVGHSADGSLLELLEGKLAVLRFQMKIKQEFEALAVKVEGSAGTSSGSPASDTSPQTNVVSDDNIASAAKDKAIELSLQLKGITQLYNDYAAPFELWESCLEIISFANYEDSDASIVRDIWARLLDQAIQRGGIAEASRVLKRIGSQFYHGEGSNLPLDTICIHLETAALERLVSGIEPVGDEDVAHALLAACKGAIQPVLNAYDQILSNIAVLPSADLRLRLLRSVLVVLREWEMMMLAKKLDTRTSGASLIFGGRLSSVGTGVLSQGIRDKISNAANRYMTEVHRLALPQSKTREIYAGFREIEEKLIGPL